MSEVAAAGGVAVLLVTDLRLAGGALGLIACLRQNAGPVIDRILGASQLINVSADVQRLNAYCAELDAVVSPDPVDHRSLTPVVPTNAPAHTGKVVVALSTMAMLGVVWLLVTRPDGRAKPAAGLTEVTRRIDRVASNVEALRTDASITADQVSNLIQKQAEFEETQRTLITRVSRLSKVKLDDPSPSPRRTPRN